MMVSIWTSNTDEEQVHRQVRSLHLHMNTIWRHEKENKFQHISKFQGELENKNGDFPKCMHRRDQI